VLRTVADARCFSHLGIAPCCAELRRFTRKSFHAVEQDRETSCPSGPGNSTQPRSTLSDEPVTGAGMDPFGDDDIAQLLRLKRDEQPPASYYENFLSEFRRRQRDELLRQPVWRICFERAHGFALRQNVRPYLAGVAVVVACAAVISIRIYQQPEHVQVAVEGSPVPNTPPTKLLELAKLGLIIALIRHPSGGRMS
jgi:hypothetical protein